MTVTTDKPTPGRIVLYHNRDGHYDVPAIITATLDSLWRPGVDAGEVPDLPDEMTVHLHVYTPGKQVQYQEHGVPYNQFGGPRTWRWPTRR